MKKIVITLAALATLSTAAFADGIGGSAGTPMLTFGDTAPVNRNLIKNKRVHQNYVQSYGTSDQSSENSIGYLSKDPGVHDSLGQNLGAQ